MIQLIIVTNTCVYELIVTQRDLDSFTDSIEATDIDGEYACISGYQNSIGNVPAHMRIKKECIELLRWSPVKGK